jgi:hypothetical protein
MDRNEFTFRAKTGRTSDDCGCAYKTDAEKEMAFSISFTNQIVKKKRETILEHYRHI